MNQLFIRRGSKAWFRASCTAMLVFCAGATLCAPSGCASSRGTDAAPDDAPLDRLAAMMTGHFSSARQAAVDPEFLDISLHMAPVPSWSTNDERWLYVEQAVAAAADKPYRQRLYRVSRLSDGTFESAVFTMPDPQKFIGAWRDTSVFATLKRDDIREREGCEVILRESGNGFNGGTEGTGCSSERSGAAYATAEVIVTDLGLMTWDRGYDANGVQVWGAEAGPYQFDRVR